MDVLEVLIEPGLVRPVVVAGVVEDRVGAVLLSHVGVVDGLDRVVGAGSRKHRGLPAALLHRLDGNLHDPAVLLLREGRTLAGGAGGADAVSAVLHLPLNDAPQRLLINRAVPEGSNESDN